MSAQLVPEPPRPYEVPPLDLPEGLSSRVRGWVSRVADLTSPDWVRWCDGSAAETDVLYTTLVALEALHRSLDDLPEGVGASPVAGSDVLRAAEEHGRPGAQARPTAEPVRPQPEPSRRTLHRLFAGCMRGRVMYVVPYATPDEPATRLGIELRDSPWVVLNLGLAARVGVPALHRIRAGHRWAASVHSVGYPLLDESGTRRPDVPWPCNPEKWIATLPGTGDVWSFGTGFGAARLADCTSA